MSFLDSIIDVGSSAWDWATGSSMGAGLARAATLGLMLREVQSSINKENQTSSGSSGNPAADVIDYGVREQVDPSTDNLIPVVYGDAYLNPRVTDAYMTPDNQTMYYVLTVCEQTGKLLSTNQDSRIDFIEVFWNESKVGFRPDGVTAESLTDLDDNTNTDIDGLVSFYFYSGNSDKPVSILGLNGQTIPAYNIMPNWTGFEKMNDLVFLIAKVTYSKEKNITGLGNLQVHVRNTLKQPGDALYDYMTNSRYGANIKPEMINS